MLAADVYARKRRLLVGGAFAAVFAAAIAGAMMSIWSSLFQCPAATTGTSGVADQPQAPQQPPDPFAAVRKQMVDRHLRARDITDSAVLDAMQRVPRERFVAADMQKHAYEDHPLPIGFGQTISQPYVVALMTQLARPTPRCRALEVGAGSGYQTAVLAELCGEVYGIEIIEPLADSARDRLAELGYKSATIRCGDGYQGWKEKAPFDVILLTAAPDHVPQPLVDQLAPGGRLVMPIGGYFQELILIEKRMDGSIARRDIAAVQFVPMTGEAMK